MTENQIHQAVVWHLQARGVPGLLFVHVPNQVRAPIQYQAQLNRMGRRKGCADLLLWHNGHSYALELKTEKGKITPEQGLFGNDFEGAGGEWAWAKGLDSALRMLTEWGLIQ